MTAETTTRNSTTPAHESPAVRARLADILVLTLTAGLIAAAVEVGTLGTARWIIDRLTRSADSFVWVVPIYYTFVFGCLAIALVLVTRFLPRIAGFRLAVISSTALASFIILLLAFYGRMNQWALAILALGIGVTLGRWAARREARVMRPVRILGVVLGVLVTIVAVGVPAVSHFREARWYDRLSATKPGAPNVLLIILDTVRATSLGLYGNSRPTTPQMEKLAARSVVFDRAYSTSPWTLPSHGTMFTGRYPHELSGDWTRPLDNAFPTLAEGFRDAGYRTAGFVANMTYGSRETGLSRGFIHYEDYPISRMYLRRATTLGYFFDTWRRAEKPSRRTVASKSARRVNQALFSWLDESGHRPFFVFLNYFDAHQPYQSPDSLRPLFRTGNEMQEGYEAAIASIDQELDKLVDSLKGRNILQNTVVIITSDHGELLGEYNLRGHANSLFIPLLHVPLLIHYPAGIPDSTRITTPVTLRDLPSTISAIAGLDRPFPGSSLTRFWDSTRALPVIASPLLARVSKGIRTPPEEPVSLGDMQSIIVDHLQFIVNGDGQRELYDLRADPPLALHRDSAPFQAQAPSLAAALRAATGGGQ